MNVAKHKQTHNNRRSWNTFTFFNITQQWGPLFGSRYVRAPAMWAASPTSHQIDWLKSYVYDARAFGNSCNYRTTLCVIKNLATYAVRVCCLLCFTQIATIETHYMLHLCMCSNKAQVFRLSHPIVRSICGHWSLAILTTTRYGYGSSGHDKRRENKWNSPCSDQKTNVLLFFGSLVLFTSSTDKMWVLTFQKYSEFFPSSHILASTVNNNEKRIVEMEKNMISKLSLSYFSSSLSFDRLNVQPHDFELRTMESPRTHDCE